MKCTRIAILVRSGKDESLSEFSCTTDVLGRNDIIMTTHEDNIFTSVLHWSLIYSALD